MHAVRPQRAPPGRAVAGVASCALLTPYGTRSGDVYVRLCACQRIDVVRSSRRRSAQVVATAARKLPGTSPGCAQCGRRPPGSPPRVIAPHASAVARDAAIVGAPARRPLLMRRWRGCTATSARRVGVAPRVATAARGRARACGYNRKWNKGRGMREMKGKARKTMVKIFGHRNACHAAGASARMQAHIRRGVGEGWGVHGKRQKAQTTALGRRLGGARVARETRYA
ncbi:hypothetical protein EV714DRAFT_240416 [Schizophyllum commune]